VITWSVTDNPPVLSVSLAGNNVVISWPITCLTFRLQQTSALSPTLWTDVPQPVVVVNNQNTMTVPILSNTLFRLIAP